MSNNLKYVWQGDEPKARIPNFRLLFKDYQHNYVEFAGKDFDSLTSEQQKYWRDLGGELIKAADAARDRACKAGESVAYVSFEMPTPDRSLEPGGKPPGRAVPREKKKSTKRSKPYERKNTRPIVHARADPPQVEQSQPQPPVVPPPPAAARQPQNAIQVERSQPQPPIIPPPPAAARQPQPQNAIQSQPEFTFFVPHPAVTPLEYFQSNDPTCPIPEGDLPGPRSDTLLREWIAYQKKAKAKAREEETRQRVQVKVVEVAKRQEEDVRAIKRREEDVRVMKRREEDVRAVKALEAKVIDWSRVLDPALMAA